MMKFSTIFSLIVSACFMLTCSAFVSPTKKHQNKITTMLERKRPDSSEEVQDAFRITEEFGIDSKESRVAWDTVEEMDASDNIRLVLNQ